MCGRFIVFTDHDAAEVLTEMVAGKLDISRTFPGSDVYPKNTAPVFVKGNGIFDVKKCVWGLPMRGKSEVIYNARAETIDEKPSFRDIYRFHRCVVPSLGFYEWNRSTKQTCRFNMESGELLFMAGIYTGDYDPHFTIVTVPANDSVSPVHHRMPLVLGADYALDWIDNDASASELLTLTPPLLRSIAI